MIGWFNHQLVKIASILEAIFPVFCVLRVGNVQPLQINRMSPQKKRLFERRYKYLGGGFKDFFIFTRNPGEVIQFDEHIFRMCWSNHQLVYILPETNTEFTMKNRPKGKETNIGGTHFSLPSWRHGRSFSRFDEFCGPINCRKSDPSRKCFPA